MAAFLIIVSLALGGAAASPSGFIATSPLPQPTLGHALVESESFLYNLGGLSGNDGVASAQNVYYARLDGAGGVGSWAQTTPLPEGVFFHAAVAVKGNIYVLGGYHYNGSLVPSNVVYWTRRNADGTLGAWQTTASLPESVFFLSAASWNGTIYVAGGWNGQTLTNGVYSASVNADGSLSSWTAQRSLPEGVYTHAQVADGTLYVLGGVVHNGSDISNTVYEASINSDARLGAWTLTTPLPVPLSNHGASFANGYVLVTGGWTGASSTSTALAAPMQIDQSLGAWTSLPSLPRPLYLHGQAVGPGYLYVSGGNDGQNPQDAVYSLPLPAPIDFLPPRTSLAIGAPRFGQAPPFVSPATPMTLSAVDDLVAVGDGSGSGVVSTQWTVDGGSFALYQAPFSLGVADGSHWLRYFSVDNAGNQESVQASSVALDGTAPVSTLSIGAPQLLLNSGAVIVASSTWLSASAQDPVVNGVASGVSFLSYGIDGGALAGAPAFFGLPPVDGPHTVTLQAVDNVQNAETTHVTILYLDETPPTVRLDVSSPAYQPPTGPPILPAAVRLSFTAEDPAPNGVASGVNRVEYALDGAPVQFAAGSFGLGEGAHSISYRAVDNIGNAGLWQAASYAVDATPPISTLRLSSGLTLFSVDVVTPQTVLTLSAEDPPSNGVASGVARLLYNVDGAADRVYAGPFTLPVGSHTISYGAVDNAGNAEPRHSLAVSVGAFLQDALAAFSEVELSGHAKVVGDVRTNGAFVAKGESSVRGDVWALSAKVDEERRVSGVLHRGAATLTEASFDLAAARTWVQGHNKNASLPPDILVDGVLTLGNRRALILAPGDYYFKGIRLSGKAAVSLGGRVNVFLDGDLRLFAGDEFGDDDNSSHSRDRSDDSEGERDDGDYRRATGLNAGGDAANLWVVMAGATASLAGDTHAAFELYAPSAFVRASGRGRLTGHVLGRLASLSGRALEASTTAFATLIHRDSGSERLPKAEDRADKEVASAPQRGGRSEPVAASRLDVSRPPQGSCSSATAAPPPGPQEPSRWRSAGQTAKNAMPKLDISSHSAFSVVTDQGGHVRSSDGSGVVVPQGAASLALAVTVAPPKPVDDLESRRRSEAAQQKSLQAVGTGVEYGPEGTHFLKPVTIEIPYDPSQRGVNGSEAALVAHYWNSLSGQWEPLPSIIDATAHVVRAQTTHFSLYQVFSGGAAAAPGVPSLSFREVYAFPNPARAGQNPTLHIEAPGADHVDIRLYDLSGEPKGGTSLAGPSSAFEWSWDVGGAGSGVYVYVITASQNGVGSVRRKGKLAVIR